ncbi:hypothetical protein H4582DRAFT_2065376 [Lactarius indigo]|nr:hypothetical protein H4582DRAFT_2065376 [Lactarius indigo]
MSQFTVHDFFDLEATVDSEEEEEFEDEELDLFFNDDVEEATSDWGSRLTSPAPTDFIKQTLEMRAGIARRSTHAAANYDEGVPRHYLVPREHDPHLWSVRVKPGHESNLVMQITRRASLGNKLDIVSVFARAGIPGFIFLEGNLSDVTRAVCGLVTVFTHLAPRLVPLEQRVALLSPRNPLSRPIEEGQWGREAGPQSNLRRPGERQEFKGLRQKNIFSATTNTALLPSLLGFAQDTIKPGQWVKVESGDHRGAIGKPFDVRDSIAYLILNSTGDGPVLQIPLRALAPFYDRGHHIKNRWSESSGIVASVDEDRKALTYIERDSQHTVAILTDMAEPYDPPLDFYRAKEGSWVKFNRRKGMDHAKRRGYIRAVKDTHALVIDEHSLEEFAIETRELEVCSTQGPSLPKNDPVHPLMGQRVTIIRGPLKGLYGNIREVGATAITVELPALMASSPIQTLKWTDLMLVPTEVETARTNPASRPRTPPPDPKFQPLRCMTPEPAAGHWLFSLQVQDIIEKKCIPFHIRGSGDGSMSAHDGNPARTVPTHQRTLSPQEGEIIVKTVKRARQKQISIRPSFLVPWKPLVEHEVVVISGPLFGIAGVVKGRQETKFTVTFTFGDNCRDFILEEKDLAPLEPLK